MPALIVRHLRRGFLLWAATFFLAARVEAGNESANPVKIRVDAKTTVGRIAPDFLGLGYETSAVAQSNYFSVSNIALIRLYRNLSTGGLIRIGGIISDHTKYIPDGTPVVSTQKGVTIINKANLEDLGAFARATGWKVMWGLNLGTGSKADAVQEALAVNAALGASLHSFEIGNEVEELRHGYEAYHKDYVDYKAAIRAALPNAPFSGPDSIGRLPYFVQFAANEAGDLKLLTTHYYRGGAGNTNATLQRLLQRDTNWDQRLSELRQVSRDHGLAYRINEINSFSGGGKRGVSDTFGSALWCLDYMFNLASYGGEGVNMETDINQLGFISHYSPIIHDASGQCSHRPEYYAMLAFAMSGNGDLLKLTLEKGDINLTAYATRNAQGMVWITVVNKDVSKDADVEAALPEGSSAASAFRLEAPSVESTNWVTFPQSKVTPNGKWTDRFTEDIVVTQGAAHVRVPHASAVLLELK